MIIAIRAVMFPASVFAESDRQLEPPLCHKTLRMYNIITVSKERIYERDMLRENFAMTRKFNS